MSNNILVFLLLALSATMAFGQGTSVGFYSKTCERAESIVTSAVKAAFNNDPTIAAGLLRLHFHDCFVSGCDASVLIDGPNTERDAGPNFSLRGFEVIDDAKKQIEAVCPGIVSCADILALAARDSVVVTSGLGWQVPTGRRDGLVSSASDVDLPSFRDSVDVLKQRFTEKGLNTQDLVALVGAHTIGSASCQFFSYRLYNFTNGGPDPSMSPDFVATLQALCPQNGDGLKRVPFDSGSENKFDTSYFTNLKNGRGLLESDQKLYTDTSTQTFVNRLLGLRGVAGLTFGIEFGKSMVKMSNIEVKTGTDGEIRKVCSAFN